jgi:UDP-glucose 4-epimerase
MRLFVTGSNGRLGKALCAAFRSEGHEVLAFSRNADKDHIALAALQHHLQAPAPADYVIHLAWSVLPATAEEDPGVAWREDLPLLERILSSLESLPSTRRPILAFFSSCAVYGEASPGRVLTEESRANPKSWYASGKLAAEQLIELYELRRGIRSLVLRVTNPYGYVQNQASPQGIIPALLRSAREDTEFSLWGSRETTKDYLHFDDLCSALRLLMEHRSTGVFNVASGESVSTDDLIRCVQDLLQVGIRVRDEPTREWDVVSGRYGNSAIKQATGWSPQVDLREGIRRLAADIPATSL